MTVHHFVYIIYSKKLDRFYIGSTTSLTERLEKHNLHFYPESFTLRATDWELIYSITCESKPQALAIENHIKSMKSRQYIENLKAYPDVAQKLLNRYPS